mgnify:CR=1 FL=1
MLRIPYCFSINLILKSKLKDAGLLDLATIHEVPLKGVINLGDFEIEYVTLTHSIPEPNALRITTPLGTIFHTGDWKIDPAPVIGAATDENRLKEIGIFPLMVNLLGLMKVWIRGWRNAGGQE